MNIGEKIKSLRMQSNKSQEELALDVGVSRQTINKWETNKTQPNAEKLKLLCSVFEVSADYFFDSELVADDEQNLTTDVALLKNSIRNKTLIICAVIVGLIFLIGTYYTVLFGCVMFSPNNNGADLVRTGSAHISYFIVALIFTVLLLSAEIILLISIFRNRQKRTRNDKK